MDAAKALAATGHVAEAAFFRAISGDRSLDPSVRSKAAQELGTLEQTEDAVALLSELTHNPNMGAWIRLDSAKALSRFGRTHEATEVLLALAEDPSIEADAAFADAAFNVATAIADLGHPEARKFLRRLARDTEQDAWVRCRAAKALGELGEEDSEIASGILHEILNDQAAETWIRVRAAEMLALFGHAERATILLLAVAANESLTQRVRNEAAGVIRRYGLNS